MTIDQMIEALQKVKRYHGNIECVTPSSGNSFDGVSAIEVMWIRPAPGMKMEGRFHVGRMGDRNSSLAVNLNF